MKVIGDTERAAVHGSILALGISAAFDAVDCHILCKRFESDVGVAGVALRWLMSLVSDLSQ